MFWVGTTKFLNTEGSGGVLGFWLHFFSGYSAVIQQIFHNGGRRRLLFALLVSVSSLILRLNIRASGVCTPEWEISDCHCRSCFVLEGNRNIFEYFLLSCSVKLFLLMFAGFKCIIACVCVVLLRGFPLFSSPFSTGHKGKFGHEFLEFEFLAEGRMRYANNSNYKNDTMIRKEGQWNIKSEVHLKDLYGSNKQIFSLWWCWFHA